MAYYKNDWQRIKDVVCDGIKLAGAATVLWAYSIYLIFQHIFSRIYNKLTDG